MMRPATERFEAMAAEPGAPQRPWAAIENKKIGYRGGFWLLASVGFAPIAGQHSTSC